MCVCMSLSLNAIHVIDVVAAICWLVVWLAAWLGLCEIRNAVNSLDSPSLAARRPSRQRARLNSHSFSLVTCFDV